MALTVFVFVLTIQEYAPPANVRAVPIPRFYNFYTVSLALLGAYPDSLWIVVVPILAALPAGDNVSIDRQRGVDATMITRVGWSRYLWGKLLANLTLAGGTTALAMATTLGVVALRYPVGLPRFLGWTVNNSLPFRVEASPA